MSKVRPSEKPQACNWCSEPATQSFLWAEGKAYIPSCDDHEAQTRAHIRKEYDDEPDAVHTVRKTAMETSEQAIDRLNRKMWDPIRAEHQAVHRGFGAELSDEDHDFVHDSSRPLHERATRLMGHVARGRPYGDSGLGVHWTTDHNVAHHFSKVDASHRVKYDEDADGEKYGHSADGIPRQRPETRIMLHAHFPEHEHIAHEEEDNDGAFGWHDRNQLKHTENGGGIDFEREVPIKRGKPVKIHAISWGLASHRADDQADHDRETTRYDFPETMTRKAVRKASMREPGSVDCWVCKGTGYVDDQGSGCEACDESGYLTPGEQTMLRHGYRPTKRLFGPTYGLDERLFDGEHFKPAIRHDLMAKWHRFCAEQGLDQPDEWSIVYFAGSEASEWTSPERKGNNDFDILVGVDAWKFYKINQGVTKSLGLEDIGDDEDNTELAHELTSRMRETLVDPAYVLPGGDQDDPWDQTWYVNPDSYRIADIRPYAAYDVTHDVWAVKPPHLPDWDLSKFPQGKALAQMGDAYDDLVQAIMKLPEPHRTQQGNALWEHLHSDRGRAFGPNGEGWWDVANVMEKWLDQEGTWKDLWELHHRADEDPSTLRAPENWSNDPLHM